ncbi:TlpA family protein disulfide reductase [Modestobacter roseus]|uniref:Thiol-disulfide isomerase/thioredoxin n=1 Tax=Modestobacter roseus TaxID=1181884 RepID=A0A562IY43_9ACTN|nr:TlpA disulfide reductase family protein [Modestobacter roseus]MQA33946.1 redoxin family protein [Modestobacter roseus]TWH75494.1 thiol-disulfide isomerase/thioredoxin [Modestobacter roseus]
MTGRLLVVLAAALLVTGCTADDDAAPEQPAPAAAPDVRTDLTACPEQPDEPAPDGELTGLSFSCFTGGSLDLGRAQGTPTVVNLWASWCPPCREELPVVQELADAAGDRLRVLSIDSQDRAAAGASFADDAGVTLPTAFDEDGEVTAALGLRSLPHTLFLAADGSVAHVQVGQVPSLAEFEQLVAEHLGVQL